MTPQDERTLSLRWFDEIWKQQREATIDELAADDLEGRMEGSHGSDLS